MYNREFIHIDELTYQVWRKILSKHIIILCTKLLDMQKHDIIVKVHFGVIKIYIHRMGEHKREEKKEKKIKE